MHAAHLYWEERVVRGFQCEVTVLCGRERSGNGQRSSRAFTRQQTYPNDVIVSRGEADASDLTPGSVSKPWKGLFPLTPVAGPSLTSPTDITDCAIRRKVSRPALRRPQDDISCEVWNYKRRTSCFGPYFIPSADARVDSRVPNPITIPISFG